MAPWSASCRAFMTWSCGGQGSTSSRWSRTIAVTILVGVPACSSNRSSPGAGAGSSGASAVGGNRGQRGGTSNGGSAGIGSGGTSGASDHGGAGGSSAGATAGASAGGTSGTSNGGTSGTPNGGSAGSEPDGSASGRDPCATARFCETFESYTTGKAPGGGWKTSMNLGAISVVDTAHFGGSKSVKCSTEQGMNGKTAYIRLDLSSVFPVPGNAYYGRMMARLESAPEQSVHWTFIQSGGLVAGQNYHALYRYGGQQPVMNGGTFVGTQLMANYETPDSYNGTGPSSDCWNHSSGKVMPVAKWTCVEWQFDGPNDTMRLWLDGAAIDSLTVQGKGQGCVHQDKTFEWKAPTFADLELGWESYQADSPRSLYIDDVVISMTRVGCPPSM